MYDSQASFAWALYQEILKHVKHQGGNYDNLESLLEIEGHDKIIEIAKVIVGKNKRPKPFFNHVQLIGLGMELVGQDSEKSQRAKEILTTHGYNIDKVAQIMREIAAHATHGQGTQAPVGETKVS